MREIKLRVHCKETGRILAYEYFNQILNWGYFWTDPSEPEDEAICHAPPEYFKHPQDFGTLIRVLYTGLKDKNGVELYEGDLIMCPAWNSPQVIFWDLYALTCYIPQIDDYSLAFLAGYKGFEIVGNIYENPELLEG